MLRPGRPSHATVVAYLALFAALGGGAYASTVAHNSVKSSSIKNGQVKSADLATKAVTNAKLGTSAVTSVKLGTGSVTDAKLDRSGACAGTGMGDVMVRVGPTCVDKYENSLWTSRTGGTQITDPIPCAENGQDCSNIYARSVAGVVPKNNITWFQAQQALANSGKRLPSNAEWQAAVAGTPDPGTDNGTSDCDVSSSGDFVNTGTRSSCVSRFGANDMVGNLYEWVADWVPLSTQCPPALYGDDENCLAGASEDAGPGALTRGGSFGFDSSAGPFAVFGKTQPSESGPLIGFRGAR